MCASPRSQGANVNANTENNEEIGCPEHSHRRIPIAGAGAETHVQSLLGYVHPQERAGRLYETCPREQTRRPASSLGGYREITNRNRHGHSREAESRLDKWRRRCRARPDQRGLLYYRGLRDSVDRPRPGGCEAEAQYAENRARTKWSRIRRHFNQEPSDPR